MAIESLLNYLEQADEHPAEIEAAIEHIQGCSTCQRRAGYLVRALRQAEADTLTCRECEALLPDYFQAEAAGETGEDYWRPVALHLATCPACALAHAELAELKALALGERDPEPPHYPKPDLSFLHPTPAPDKSESRDRTPDLSFLRPLQARPSLAASLPWRIDELGRLLLEFSAGLGHALLQPAPATAGLKGSDQDAGLLGQLVWQEPGADLEVTIRAETTPDDPSRCAVVVEVNIPSRGGWPNLADTEVTLKRGEQELETQVTDAYGQVIFEEIATADLPQLVFAIGRSEAQI